MIIGSHVSFGTDSLLGCVKEALSYGANTFMFYTGAPQNTIRKKIDDKNTTLAHNLMKENKIDINKVICHAPYIINLANKEKLSAYEFSINFLKEEISRCHLLGVKYIVVHPGSAVKEDRNVALKNISFALNKVLETDKDVIILLETMAGKGTECGKDLNEIKTILSGIIYQDKIGVCLDTCHLNDSGISIQDFDNYLQLFDKEIGLNKIGCVHINDSLNEISSHKDRHANIGYGTIGFDNLINVIYHDKLKDVPKILETPYIENHPPYKEEIQSILNKNFNPNLKEEVIEHYKNL